MPSTKRPAASRRTHRSTALVVAFAGAHGSVAAPGPGDEAPLVEPQGGRPAPCERRVTFFSEFGDPTHAYDNSNGSVDRFTSYYTGQPDCVRSMYADGSISDTDNPLAATGRFYPFALLNLPAFDPERLEWGYLRWDVYYQHRGNYRNDNLGVFDPHSCDFATGAVYDTNELVTLLIERGEDREQWISLHLDLRTGWISATGSDQFGRPVPGKTFGEFYRVPQGYLKKILDVASRGSVYGRVGDDLRLSYVAIAGSAEPAMSSEPIAPETLESLRGTIEAGSHAQLADLDNQYLLVYAQPEGSAQVVELAATFRVPEHLRPLACRARVELQGNTTYASKSVEILALIPSTGKYVSLGAGAEFGGQDRPGAVTLDPCSDYLAPDGTVKVRLRTADPLNIPLVGQFRTFKISLDQLRLNLRISR